MTTSPASSAEDLLPDLRQRLHTVRDAVAAAGRAPSDVRIVAVTKGFGPTHCEAAAAAGLLCVGENYATELAAKRAAVTAPLRWHYLGAVQRNKAALIAAASDVVASVVRASELEALARHGRPTIYLELDYSGAPHRRGASEAEIPALLEAAGRVGLSVVGLMTVAPRDDTAASAFARLRAAADAFGLAEVSMGMSDDYPLALRAGSTELRLGRALFGPRPLPGRRT